MMLSRTSLRYCIAGLVIGGFWYLNRDRAPWQEAIRTCAVFVIIIVFLRARLRKAGIQMQVFPLLISKVALVVVAAFIETAMIGVVWQPAAVTAVGLGAAVALLGPLADRHFFRPATNSR